MIEIHISLYYLLQNFYRLFVSFDAESTSGFDHLHHMLEFFMSILREELVYNRS